MKLVKSPDEMIRSLARGGVQEKIDALELAMSQSDALVELEVRHTFLPGLYVRELRSPAGILATTYIHKVEHPFFVLAGDVSVFDGLQTVRVTAPFMGITKPGTRRVVFVHQEAIWTTVHPTTKTTVEEVEEEIFDVRELPDGTNIKDRARIAYDSVRRIA